MTDPVILGEPHEPRGHGSRSGLKRCRGCGRYVEAQASQCPYCKRAFMGRELMTVLVVLILAMVAAAVFVVSQL